MAAVISPPHADLRDAGEMGLAPPVHGLVPLNMKWNNEINLMKSLTSITARADWVNSTIDRQKMCINKYVSSVASFMVWGGGGGG